MKFEYDYTIGQNGIAFSLVDNHADKLVFEGNREDDMTIQKYIMLAWQDAINHISEGPDEIRRLMATEEGQKQLADRAASHLEKLLDDIPAELDRRENRDKEDRARAAADERRRPGKTEPT